MSWRRGQAYGQDLRDRVLAACGSIHQVAVRFGVSDSYVCRVLARHRRLAETTPGQQCGHMPRRLAGLDQVLKDRVAARVDRTIDELCAWVEARPSTGLGSAGRRCGRP